ncbi:hypothetical protein LTR85_002538 [Meristemomyces frigidus]|nr:hypothetical protein LTR85_002538 [Meristemomyces frigidus]
MLRTLALAYTLIYHPSYAPNLQLWTQRSALETFCGTMWDKEEWSTALGRMQAEPLPELDEEMDQDAKDRAQIQMDHALIAGVVAEIKMVDEELADVLEWSQW